MDVHVCTQIAYLRSASARLADDVCFWPIFRRTHSGNVIATAVTSRDGSETESNVGHETSNWQYVIGSGCAPDVARGNRRVLAVAVVRPAGAQGPALEGGTTQIPTAPAASEFMSRTDLRLGAAALSSDDQRFKWDTHFGGDIDVLDYVRGRLRVVADYQAMLGDEFRPFDPNQGNYVLEPSVSLRVGGFEIAGLFHHESRHLSDRIKKFSIDWNVLGGRVLKRADTERMTLEVEAGFGGVVKHTFTDYKWVGDTDVLVRRQLSDRMAVYVRSSVVVYGVDGTVPRDNRRVDAAKSGCG